MNKELEPIKTVAGRLLLFLYLVQRKRPHLLQNTVFEFITRTTDGIDQNTNNFQIENKDIKKGINSVSKNSLDLYNAFKYLIEKHFITATWSVSNTTDLFAVVMVVADGVDVIEGVEKSTKQRKEFNVIFNLNIENNLNVESLLKTQLGSIFSLFGGL